MRNLHQYGPESQTDERCSCGLCGSVFADALAWSAHRPWKSRTKRDKCRWPKYLYSSPNGWALRPSARDAVKAAEEGSADAYAIVLDQCVYCGDPAQSRDHTTPYAHAGRIPRRKRRGGSDAGETVPACTECNSALRDQFIVGVESRRAFIYDWLRERYAQTIAARSWTSDELSELGPTLRTDVEAGIARKRRLERRLVWSSKSTSGARSLPIARVSQNTPSNGGASRASLTAIQPSEAAA